MRLGDALGAAGRGLAVGVVDARHAQGDDLDAVAVLVLVGGDRRAGVQRAGEDQADAALLEHVGDLVARAGLQAAVGDALEAEGVRVVVGRLERVPHVQLDVVDAVERHEVVIGDRREAGRGGNLLSQSSALLGRLGPR